MATVAALGVVRRLQVQTAPLKPGPRGARVYDPSPLVEVQRLLVEPRGVTGLLPEGSVIDAHHADHPLSRNNRLLNGLSVLPAAHDEQMRAFFGPQVSDGCAGESLLVDTTGEGWSAADLAGDLLLETEDGPPLRLELVSDAPPCVEFSRWMLGRGTGPVDDEVKAAMAFLSHGRRGFYLRPVGSGVVVAGARLSRAAPPGAA